MIKPEEIKQKKARLEEIKRELKTEFFGIDEVIDKVISSIESWYIIPQALKSPIIVNLWGLTGVGKTQLVRSLVKKLNQSTKFVEIQMDGYSTVSTFGKDSICSILQSSNIQENEPGIVLLDEFQRYRTIDEKGNGMEVRRYQDVWMLLSDGKFSTDFSLYTELERQMYNNEFYAERDEEDDGDDEFDGDDEEEKPTSTRRQPREIKPFVFKLSYYEAQTYKRLLRLQESIGEIMKWPEEKLKEMCRVAMEKRESSEIDYSKLLIFVCGNLDEAFQIADDLENCDTDADIFYKMSKRISVIDIKAALKERFKPEQISRLGNNHVIYPSLNKKAYERIIEATVQKYIDFVQKLGITLKPDATVFKEIYANSVYPTQGARPVFSSIHKIFSSAIPTIALWATERKVTRITMSIDPKKSQIAARARGKKVAKLIVPIDLDIREQKEKNSLDFNTMVSVHEAGHGVVHALLTGLAPIDVSVNLATYKGGYMMDDENFDSKTDLMNGICCGLAGTVAEEVFFGDMNRSSGCSSDIDQCTIAASSYFRSLNFGDNVAAVWSPSRTDEGNTNFHETNLAMEKMLQNLRAKTKKLIEDNKLLMIDVVTELLEHNTVTPERFIEIAKKHGIKLKEQTNDVNTNYAQLWEQAKKLALKK